MFTYHVSFLYFSLLKNVFVGLVLLCSSLCAGSSQKTSHQNSDHLPTLQRKTKLANVMVVDLVIGACMPILCKACLQSITSVAS